MQKKAKYKRTVVTEQQFRFFVFAQIKSSYQMWFDASFNVNTSCSSTGINELVMMSQTATDHPFSSSFLLAFDNCHDRW